MGKFDGYLFCTDLDGTLLNNAGKISPENRDAIAWFKAEGGLFTFITGRMPFFVTDMVREVDPNTCIGCVNGGGLYDTKRQQYLWTDPVPHDVLELVRAVETAMPHLGVQVNTFTHTWFCRENVVMREFRRITGLENLVCTCDDIRDPIAKILFGCETEEDMQSLRTLLENHPRAEEFFFIRSEKHLFEILPKGSGKGRALSMLAKHLEISREKTIAAGDYDNDVSMLQAAGIGIAVANASSAAMAAAKAVTVSNEEHAIARIICDLENGKWKGDTP